MNTKLEQNTTFLTAAEICTMCAQKLDIRAGRYRYNGNSYCPKCWQGGHTIFMKEIRRDYEVR